MKLTAAPLHSILFALALPSVGFSQVYIAQYGQDNTLQGKTSYSLTGSDGSGIGGVKYDTSGVWVTWNDDTKSVDIRLFTGYKQGTSDNNLTQLADLFLDLDNDHDFETAVALSTHGSGVDQGDVFKSSFGGNISAKYSSDFFGNTNYTYGRYWSDADFLNSQVQDARVQIKSSSSNVEQGYDATVTSGINSGYSSSNQKYYYEISLTNLADYDTLWKDGFGLFFGTATCDNDAYYVYVNRDSAAPVPPLPEPSTYGLMGVVGLASLAAMRRLRRKRAS